MRFRTLIWSIVITLAALENSLAAGENWALHEGQHPQIVVTPEGKKIELLLFLPKEFAARRWPVILFLHGAGQRGNDLQLVRLRAGTLPKVIDTRTDFPFIVVSPQLSAEEPLWNSADILSVLDDVLKNVSVDATRIYVTGVSIGGNGVWQLASEAPQRFA